MSATAPPRTTRLVDIVFPGDTNHHGTLFGGVGLAHMDKVAFIAASRHGRVDFVTASCERIDFAAPAYLGELIEISGTILRVGRRSLAVAADLVAESLLSGERRLCSRGVFNMVAVGDGLVEGSGRLPPLATAEVQTSDRFRTVEMVLPEQTSHYGTMYGGHALIAMGKAAFVAASHGDRRRVEAGDTAIATDHLKVGRRNAIVREASWQGRWRNGVVRFSKRHR